MALSDLAMTHQTLPPIRCGDKTLDLSSPRVMGILNLTPDSFFDGGKYTAIDAALARVEEMIAEGAHIIDIGAESSRPYAKSISLQEEIDRIMQTLVAIKARFDTLISVDTYKPSVMQEAIKLKVNIINDIYALQQTGALETVAQSNVAVALMHMQGAPKTMQDQPTYSHVVQEVGDFLRSRALCCQNAGIARDRIIIDPGFGYGKTTIHNMTLLKNLNQLTQVNFPLLVGLSRKSSIGELLSLPVEQRLNGSIAANVIAAMAGASLIRTHDIKATVEALKIAEAVLVQETVEWL